MSEKLLDVSIVIVNYNARDFLDECLTSIGDSISQNISCEVIVVDNNSSDNSARMVEEKHHRITLVSNKENVGFSKANNTGVKRSKGRYILFLNPDTVISKNSLEEMVSFMDENQNVGAATCFLQLPNGELDDASHRGFPTPWNAFCHFSGLGKLFPKTLFFNGYHLGWKNIKEVHEIDALAGAFMFVRREAGQNVGWWDEEYFFYGEDLDFCYKLKEKGWKIYFVPTVSVLHYKGVSGGIKKHSQHLTTADMETKLRATRARFEAMKIFYRKHYRAKYPSIITWFVLVAIDLKLRYTLKSLGS